MKLTKTQIHYLENKLDRVVSEKKSAYVNSLNIQSLDKEILKRLKANEIKLLPKAEILNKIADKISNGYYSSSIYIYELIGKDDKERIETEIQEKQDLINKYTSRLQEVKSNMLDKIVLEGVDLETALAELESVQY